MLEQTSTIVGLCAFLSLFTIWAVTIRLTQRKLLSGQYRTHDWLILVATVFALSMSLTLMIGTHFGLGSHETSINPQDLITMRKAILVTNIVYFTCNMFIKISLLSFYLELTLSRLSRYFISFMYYASIIFGSSSIVVVLAQCYPMAKIFNPEVQGSCAYIDFGAFMLANAGIMIGTDIILYAMPIVFTWGLQMSKAAKIGLYVVFGLGLLVLLSSILRILPLTLTLTTPHADFPFYYGTIMICSAIENHIAIWVACGPYIKSAGKSFSGKFSSAYSSFKSRVMLRSRERDGGDEADITSLGPPSGPPMIPPVRREGWKEGWGKYGYFEGRVVRAGTGVGVGVGVGMVRGDIVDLDQRDVHPALRTPTPDMGLEEEGKEELMVRVQAVDSVAESARGSAVTLEREGRDGENGEDGKDGEVV